MCGSGKFLKKEKPKGRHPKWAANTGSGWVGGLEGWAHHWINIRAEAVGGRHTDWGPGLEDGPSYGNSGITTEIGSPQVGELEGKGQGQGRGRELTSRLPPAARAPCDPGEVTGKKQVRGGPRPGHRAGARRAGWGAAQDDPASWLRWRHSREV